jgi:hypothetical protein
MRIVLGNDMEFVDSRRADHWIQTREKVRPPMLARSKPGVGSDDGLVDKFSDHFGWEDHVEPVQFSTGSQGPTQNACQSIFSFICLRMSLRPFSRQPSKRASLSRAFLLRTLDIPVILPVLAKREHAYDTTASVAGGKSTFPTSSNHSVDQRCWALETLMRHVS